jgi:hypothetical protein
MLTIMSVVISDTYMHMLHGKSKISQFGKQLVLDLLSLRRNILDPNSKIRSKYNMSALIDALRSERTTA